MSLRLYARSRSTLSILSTLRPSSILLLLLLLLLLLHLLSFLPLLHDTRILPFVHVLALSNSLARFALSRAHGRIINKTLATSDVRIRQNLRYRFST